MSERVRTDEGAIGSRVISRLPGTHPKRGAIAVCVFLALGLTNVVLLLLWGGLWALAVLPPVLFCAVLVWVVFGTDFLEGRS